MIVTTGGRGARSSGSSSKNSSSSSSSEAWRMTTSRSTSTATSCTASSLSDCVMVIISPRTSMILMICAAGMPRAEERSLTETPDWTTTGPLGLDSSRPLPPPPEPAGPRPVGRTGGRAAPLSMTTRRLRRPATAPRGRTGRLGGRVELDSSADIRPQCRGGLQGKRPRSPGGGGRARRRAARLHGRSRRGTDRCRRCGRPKSCAGRVRLPRSR